MPAPVVLPRSRLLRKPTAVVSRPAVEVADILHAQGDTFLEQHPWLSVQQRSVLRAIARCRTAALGGHLDRCDACGHQAISYNSCRNRHCPKCQAQARERWLHARERELLDVPYVHVVFTLPHALLPLAYRNSARLYTWLFQASAATLREVAADPRHLGAEIGVLSILHTWGQTLVRHPHVHCVVPAGGLSPRSSALDSAEVRRLLPAREGPQSSLSREVCRGAPTRVRPERTRSRRRQRAPARPGAVARLRRRALRDRLGRLRQAGLRWRVSRAAVPRALHPSRRDQQSPPARLRRRARHVSVEGLRPRRSAAHDDAIGDGVSAPLRPAHPAARLRPHPAVGVSREHLSHRPRGPRAHARSPRRAPTAASTARRRRPGTETARRRGPVRAAAPR